MAMDKTMGRISKFIMILFSICLAIGLTLLIDRSISIIHIRGIIFKPNMEAHNKMADFEFTAKINSFGFRDREFENPKKKFRILAVGNSFTFGLGVDLEEAWPKILERNLQKRGINIEIANLGKPGGSICDYAQICEEAIPLLRPDLILIGVSQGHDLADLGYWHSFIGRFRSIANYLYPNIVNIYQLFDKQLITSDDFRNEQIKEAKEVLGMMTKEERRRFERLDNDIQNAFLDGNLNPALINHALRHSSKFVENRDIRNPYTQSLIDIMATQLIKIKRTAENNNIKALVFSVPFKCYVSVSGYKMMEKEGFLLDEAILKDDSGDYPIKIACERAGLPFISVMNEFREESKHTELYFALDDHFNAAGYKFFADSITPQLIGYCDKLSNMQVKR
jgi:lysophospholipase L1-like esterase